MLFLKKFFILSNFYIFILFSMSFNLFADISENIEEIKKLISLDERIPKEYEHLSPILGVLALRSQTLANIRIYGNYGPENNDFLCHKQITSRQKDCPQDHTTAIIQNIFVSGAGGTLEFSNAISDYFSSLSMENIGKLLKDFNNNSIESDKNYFINLLEKKKFKKVADAWTKFFTIGNKKVTQGEAIKILGNKYWQMFLGAKDESDDYPPHIVTKALLALAIKKASLAKDLEPLLKEIFDDVPNDIFDETNILSKDSYDEFKRSITDKSIHELFKNKQDLIFNTLAYDFFDSDYPVMIGTGRVLINEKKFSDCVESSLRNFFNILLSDADNRNFDINKLILSFPNASFRLKNFYKEIQNTFDSVITKKSRDEWALIVSNLNQEKYNGIIYNKGICDLFPNIKNVLKVIKLLLNDDELNKINGLDEQLEFILEKFSSDLKKFDWRNINGDKSLTNIFDEIIILDNNREMFSWVFKLNHSDFIKIAFNKNDWRKDKRFLSLLLKNQDEVSKSLIPFYLSSNNSTSEILIKNENIGYLSSIILYGLPLRNLEQKLWALNMASMLKSLAVLKVANRWFSVTDLESDDVQKKLAISWFNIKNNFSNHNFNDKKLDDLFKKFQVKLCDNINDIINYFYFYSEDFLLYNYNFLDNYKNLDEKIISNLIYKSLYYNFLGLFGLLINDFPDVAYQIDGSTGQNILHVAVETNASLEIIRLILDYAPFDLNIGDLCGQTPLEYVSDDSLYGEQLIELLNNYI